MNKQHNVPKQDWRSVLSKELLERIPVAREVDDDPNPMVHARITNNGAGWVHYIIARADHLDGDRYFFGLVDGSETELGTFDLAEVVKVHNDHGWETMMDPGFTPRPLHELMDKISKADKLMEELGEYGCERQGDKIFMTMEGFIQLCRKADPSRRPQLIEQMIVNQLVDQPRKARSIIDRFDDEGLITSQEANRLLGMVYQIELRRSETQGNA